MNNDTMNQEICLCSMLTLPELAFIDVYGVVHEKPQASGTMKFCDNYKKQNKPFADLGTNPQQAAANFIAQPPCNLDPFEIELERLHQEKDLIEASYEKLKFDCEKEMEEEVAQIQSIYNTKLQVIEAEFQLGMKEIYANYYKVLMNKRLACTFRSECIDLKLDSSVSSSTPNLQLDGEIRSLAPHLQPFRPRPATISSPSFPRHTPSLGAAINCPLSSSPSCPLLQPQLPLPSNLPITSSGAHELNDLMNLRAPNSSLSALGLFMDMNRRADLILPNSAHASSTLSANTTNNAQVILQDGDGPDIICLSDDD